jgi:hypothetical protein
VTTPVCSHSLEARNRDTELTAVWRHNPVYSTVMEILEFDRDDPRVGGRHSFCPGFVPVHACGFSASPCVLPDDPRRLPGLDDFLGCDRGVLEAMRETTERARHAPADDGPVAAFPARLRRPRTTPGCFA